MKKSYFLKKRLLQSLLPLVVISSLLFWFLGTNSGLQTFVNVGRLFLPGTFTYQSITGTLLSPITIQDLHYHHPKFSFLAKRLNIQFEISALFNNTISIPALFLEEGLLNFNADHLLHMNNLRGKLKIKTPAQYEMIEISDFKGMMSQKELLGSLFFFRDQQEIKDLKSEIKWGESHLTVVRKATKETGGIGETGETGATGATRETKASGETEATGELLWQLLLKPKKEITLTSQGIAHYNRELFRLQGTITDALLSSDYTDDWQLKNPSDFILSENNFSILPMRFKDSKNSELFIQLGWDNQKGKNIIVNMPDFTFKSDVLKGNISLDLALDAPPGQPLQGRGELLIKPGRAKIYLTGNKYYETHYRGGKLSAVWNTMGLNLNLNFIENVRNILNANLIINEFSPQKPLAQQKLQGEFSGKIQDVSLFYLLAPYISRLKAVLDFSGYFQGNLAEPAINFQAHLHDTIFSIPKQHITLKSVVADLHGVIPGDVHIKSSGTLGGNPFYIQGISEIKPQGKSNFEITGDKIRIYNTGDLHIIASPKLNLSVRDEMLFLDGTLQINEANILQKDELKAITTSNDVIFTDKQEETLMGKLTFVPNIEILIDKENKVHFKGHGLEALLRGKLKIERRPDGLFTGTGKLSIREGKYRLQGNHYQINRGLLLYTPGTLLNDPLLEIRIFKRRAGQIEEATEVGIYVQGTLQNPTYQFYSTNDDIQSSEIIAKLGFGGNNIEEKDEKQQLLTQTAQLLAEGANPIIGNLQAKLALEEFGIQSAESQKIITNHGGYDTVLVVGKSLSKRIYLQFIQGMLEPLSVLRIKYFISPRFAVGVESSTAEDIGGDVSFSMERN